MKDTLHLQNSGTPDDPSYRFGSCHTEGINTAFCDGSVGLLNFAIDINVLGALGTRNSKATECDSDVLR